MVALLTALRKHDIQSPGGGGPPPVGSWENPGYSVNITDTEAQEARARYEAEEEEKRLKKLNGDTRGPEEQKASDSVPRKFAATARLVTHFGTSRGMAAKSPTSGLSKKGDSFGTREELQARAAEMDEESELGDTGAYELEVGVNRRHRKDAS
jgi:hypothetical protein